ncbi:MAG: SBBP repeat-containing protein [bacterium]|nr:MAG: SBBP repeat-containing protein [bacterium]
MKRVINISVSIIYLLLALLTSGCNDNSTGPDGKPPSNEPNHIWSKRFGNANTQYSNGVACDGSGNLVITGRFRGSVDFGGGELISEGGKDIFIAKFDANGNHIWSKRFGDSSNQDGNSVAFDESGNVLVTGDFLGSVDFGGGPLRSEGEYDIFLVKFDANANHLWSKSFGDESLDYGQSVSCDGLGNVIVTGTFIGSVDFGGGLLTGAGGIDIFLAKYDANGNHIWSKRFGGVASTYCESIACNASGDAVFTGSFNSPVDFGDGEHGCAGQCNSYLAVLDSDGAHRWSKSFSLSGCQVSNSVACDGSGNAVITGYFNGMVYFGGDILTSVGSDIGRENDIFIAMFDANGNHIWSKRFGDSGSGGGSGVGYDVAGNVVITGGFHDTMNFGGGTLTSVGESDIFIVKFDANGNHLWSKSFRGENSKSCESIICDESGNVVVTGSFEGTLDFGGEALTSAGSYDIFLAKFEP